MNQFSGLFLHPSVFPMKHSKYKPDRIYSPAFFMNQFSGLFLHPSVFSMKHSKYK